MKYLGLIVVLGATLVQGEEVNTPVSKKKAEHSCQQASGLLHPVKTLERAHNRFVNLAIRLSSIGIEQPADTPAAAFPASSSATSAQVSAPGTAEAIACVAQVAFANQPPAN